MRQSGDSIKIRRPKACARARAFSASPTSGIGWASPIQSVSTALAPKSCATRRRTLLASVRQRARSAGDADAVRRMARLVRARRGFGPHPGPVLIAHRALDETLHHDSDRPEVHRAREDGGIARLERVRDGGRVVCGGASARGYARVALQNWITHLLVIAYGEGCPAWVIRRVLTTFLFNRPSPIRMRRTAPGYWPSSYSYRLAKAVRGPLACSFCGPARSCSRPQTPGTPPLPPGLPSDRNIPQPTVPLGWRSGLQIGRAQVSDSPFLRFPVSPIRRAVLLHSGGSLEQMSTDSQWGSRRFC